jgi:DNA-directed RNA polymerase subunit RPC12/RpoP
MNTKIEQRPPLFRPDPPTCPHCGQKMYYLREQDNYPVYECRCGHREIVSVRP